MLLSVQRGRLIGCDAIGEQRELGRRPGAGEKREEGRARRGGGGVWWFVFLGAGGAAASSAARPKHCLGSGDEGETESPTVAHTTAGGRPAGQVAYHGARVGIRIAAKAPAGTGLTGGDGWR